MLHHVGRRALTLEVLDDVALGATARSELDVLALLRELRLPLPDRLQRPVRTSTGKRFLDAWWERYRLAVEIDGAQHMEVRGWDADTLRANSHPGRAPRGPRPAAALHHGQPPPRPRARGAAAHRCAALTRASRWEQAA